MARLFDMRLAIEMGAAHLAAERAGPVDIERLKEHNATMRVSGGVWADYRRADAFFHLAIAEAAGSPRLIASMTEIHGQLSELLAHLPHPTAALESATEQHDTIIAAIAAHDAREAVACMRAHVEGLSAMARNLLPANGDSTLN